MGDSFTNILLVALITLIGFIGKIFYEKLEQFSKKIEIILQNDVGINKDIERLKEDYDDHETRISKLEDK